jgi:hypothetical protein
MLCELKQNCSCQGKFTKKKKKKSSVERIDLQLDGGIVKINMLRHSHAIIYLIFSQKKNPYFFYTSHQYISIDVISVNSLWLATEYKNRTLRNIWFKTNFLQLFSVCYKIIGVMVGNATLNNISVISWRSVLLVEETGPVASH